jgi:hypothetical protein
LAGKVLLAVLNTVAPAIFTVLFATICESLRG